MGPLKVTVASAVYLQPTESYPNLASPSQNIELAGFRPPLGK